MSRATRLRVYMVGIVAGLALILVLMLPALGVILANL